MLVKELTEKDLVHLIKAQQIQLELGVYNHTSDLIFEEIRKSSKADLFFSICDKVLNCNE